MAKGLPVDFAARFNVVASRRLPRASEIKKINGILVPHKFIMRDEKEDSETELTVVKMEVDPAINDSLFDPAKLKDNRGSE